MPNNYSARSPFVRVLSDSNRVNILDVFITKGKQPLTIEDLKEFTNLPDDEIQKHLEVLIAADLIETKNHEVYRCLDNKKVDALRAYHLQSHLSQDEIMDVTDEVFE